MDKLLTIAIPTYNRKKYIDIALNSVFSQYDERIEVIVSDNCSTDGTGEYVKEKYPGIVYYKNEENVGMENFQRCYKRATGKYILLLGDDDVITEGSLKVILDFLETNEDMALVFMNHTSFEGNYTSVDNCKKSFIDKKIGDFITTDKVKFMSCAKHQLTFISCFILSREAYRKIDNPDQYNKNWFLQTCVAFSIAKGENTRLGVISRVCIAQNVTENKKNSDMNVIIDVFGVTEEAVLCDFSEQCGFNRKQMEKIYSDYICAGWPGIILGYKAKGYTWKEPFWTRGYPIVKKYPKAWFTIIPAALVPDFAAKFARNLIHRLKGIKDE